MARSLPENSPIALTARQPDSQTAMKTSIPEPLFGVFKNDQNLFPAGFILPRQNLDPPCIAGFQQNRCTSMTLMDMKLSFAPEYLSRNRGTLRQNNLASDK